MCMYMVYVCICVIYVYMYMYVYMLYMYICYICIYVIYVYIWCGKLFHIWNIWNISSPSTIKIQTWKDLLLAKKTTEKYFHPGIRCFPSTGKAMWDRVIDWIFTNRGPEKSLSEKLTRERQSTYALDFLKLLI